MEKLHGARIIFRHYRSELKKHPWNVTSLMLLVPLGIFLNNFAAAYIAAQAIDKLSREGRVPANMVWDEFGTYILLFVGAAILGELIVWRLVIYLVWRLEIKVSFDLHRKMFRFLAHQSAEFHADRFGGSLVSQSNKFQASYVRMADTFIFNFLPFISTLVFTIAILATRVPWFALIQFTVAVVFIAITLANYSRITSLSEKASEAGNKLSGQIADMISNVLAVKSFSAEAHEDKRFFGLNKQAAQAEKAVMSATIHRDIGFAFALTVLLVATFISIIYGQAFVNISIGTMVLMLTYSLTLFNQLWNVNGIARSFNRVYGDALPMATILETDVQVTDPEKPEPLRVSRGAIVFDNVVFRYGDATDTVFEKLSLDIKPGQRVGLVGPSGSGKTTITNILLRYVNIESGSVTIDGQEISKVTQHDLRSAISYVPQQPLLFHRSIAENIAYGKPEATMKEIHDAANKANAKEFIERLPNNFETLVGERGVKLSGGQRQRIAIARAILKDAPILVLDEATSALDSESELLIQASFGELMKGRTSIVIAHRLSTIAQMDRIIVLDKGRIIEDGTHEKLLAQKGMYAKLWSHQSGGFIEG